MSTGNRFLDRKERQAKGNIHGRKGEKRAMKQLGARLVPGSGAMDSAKSDGYTKEFQFENKTTLAKSYGLKLETLVKIKDEARAVGRVPILSLSFVVESGRSVDDGDYIIMRRADFDELREGIIGEIR